MDQPADSEPVEEIFDSEEVSSEAPHLETPLQKYMREYRLLNSMLISLFLMVLFLVCFWNLIIWTAPEGDGMSDFSDATPAPKQKKQQQQKVKLMQRQKAAKSSKSFNFQAKAISDIAAPDIDIKALEINPSIAISPMGDVGDVRVKVDMSALDKAFASTFMGMKSQANKICFIIDYSASMRGRDLVMRDELSTAIDKLPAVGSVCVMFFSGPTWLAGENANVLHKKWKGTNSAGWAPVAGFTPSRPKWIPVTPSTKKKLTEAVWETPLTFGTVWNNSFEWAFYLNPKPDIIYFMTDGNSNPKLQGMNIIKTRKGRTKIYTIGYGAPPGAKKPLQEIAAMTGGKSKFVDMAAIQKMEKAIPAKKKAMVGKKKGKG
jgi:hypothetical protein